MNAEPPIDGSSEHREICGLLPWYVNGTLRDGERRRVDAHLQACARCREDLRLETCIHAAISTGAAVAYMPAVSLKRLHRRLDALQPGDRGPGFEPRPTLPDRPPVAWRGWKVASVMVMVLGLALGLVAAEQWRQSHTPATYYTVTTAAAPLPNTVIRAVFSPQISIGELKSVLDEAQLYIVGGPSEAGVYSLAPTSDRDPAQAVALLRAHPTVRFAELTRSERRPPAAP